MGGLNLGRVHEHGLGKIAVATGSLAALLTLATAARAQPAAARLVPIVTPLRGDDLFASQYGPTATAAFAPLRLSLTGGLFAQGNAFTGCDSSRTDASGNSVNGFATQYYSFVRLAPQLVLHGFSNTGCAIDAGMGGGLTYTVPLRKGLWLVSSAGLYGLPSAAGGATSAIITASARVDVVKQLHWGRTLSLGLGSKSVGSGQYNSLNFGGSF